MPNSIALGQTVQAYVQRSAGKHRTPRVLHFNVTQCHRNWQELIVYL